MVHSLSYKLRSYFTQIDTILLSAYEIVIRQKIEGYRVHEWVRV